MTTTLKIRPFGPNLIPYPDKLEKWPQSHKDTKQNGQLKFSFVFWCLGGENVLPQNAQKLFLRYN
jgi:hypothetical protein